MLDHCSRSTTPNKTAKKWSAADFGAGAFTLRPVFVWNGTNRRRHVSSYTRLYKLLEMRWGLLGVVAKWLRRLTRIGSRTFVGMLSYSISNPFGGVCSNHANVEAFFCFLLPHIDSFRIRMILYDRRHTLHLQLWLAIESRRLDSSHFAPRSS